jgi:hypothetical protein
MAAGGFKEFVAGEVLDEDEINDYLMQGMLVFAGTAARGSAITSPVEGQFSFLKDSDTVEFWDGSDWVQLGTGLIPVQYVVIAGGGGAGWNDTSGWNGAGGGAGGYRSSVAGESSGGGGTAESQALLNGTYFVTVGAGGAGGSTSSNGTSGSNSEFAGVLCIGGGGGGRGVNGGGTTNGLPGGCGGGAGSVLGGSATGGAPVPRQGFVGGAYNTGSGSTSGRGGTGGGAGGAGQISNTTPQPGGLGVASSITGSSVTRAVGGRTAVAAAANAAANTGNGGETGQSASASGFNGGSGVVLFAVPTGTSVSFSGGVTQSSATVGLNTVYTVTATSTTSETVTIG